MIASSIDKALACKARVVGLTPFRSRYFFAARSSALRLLLGAALLVGVQGTAPCQNPLGVLPIGGQLYDLNERGDLLGRSYRGSLETGGWFGFLYRNGQIVELGDPVAMNEAGDVISVLGGRCFLWKEGSTIEVILPDMPISNIAAINNIGDVIGQATLTSGYDQYARGFLFRNGQGITLSLGGESFASAINDNGDVIGNSSIDRRGDRYAFLYRNGALIPLSLGGRASWATGLNSSGDVIGWSLTPEPTAPPHAFLYRDDQMIDLGGLGHYGEAGAARTVPLRVNEAGDVVGYFETGMYSYANLDGVQHAFLYRNGQIAEIDLPGDEEVTNIWLNNKGDVVIQAEYWIDPYNYVGDCRAFLLRDNQLTPLSHDGGQSFAIDLNEAGDVIGQADLTGTGYMSGAFLYRDGQMVGLGLPGAGSSSPIALNEDGDVIGGSSFYGVGPSYGRPFLYRNAKLYDLGSFGNMSAGANLLTESGFIAGQSSMGLNPPIFLTHRDSVFVETPVEKNVDVNISGGASAPGGATISFAEVTAAGTTSVSNGTSGVQAPYKLYPTDTYYDITTTATYTGEILVSLHYDPDGVTNEANFKLMHLEGGIWKDVTVGVDTINNVITGNVTSLSPFVIVDRSERNVSIDVKPGVAPNSINLGSNGSVPVAILSSVYFDATTVDPLSIRLADAQVRLKGNGTAMVSFEDVDGDGRSDLVAHVSTQGLQLTEVATKAVLTATTLSGERLRGSDLVQVVP